jgi:hypothetical protein
MLAFAKHGAGFRPSRRDVAEVDRGDELSLGTAPAMRHRVGLTPARFCHIPAFGTNRNLMFEQRARFGSAVAPTLEREPTTAQRAIDGACTHREQQGRQLGSDLERPRRSRQPQRQERGQALRPRVASGTPDRLEDAHHLGAVARVAAAPLARDGRPAKQRNGVLAVIAGDGRERVQQPTPLPAPRRPVLGSDLSRVGAAHCRLHWARFAAPNLR